MGPVEVLKDRVVREPAIRRGVTDGTLFVAPTIGVGRDDVGRGARSARLIQEPIRIRVGRVLVLDLQLVEVEVGRHLDDLIPVLYRDRAAFEGLGTTTRVEDPEIGENDRLVRGEAANPPFVEIAAALEHLPRSNELVGGRR